MQKQSNSQNIEHIRHSLAHLLAAAVLKKFPNAKLGIGPVIENGFYYDFLLPRTLAPDDLKEFEKTMRELIAQHLPFTGKKITPAEAKRLFAKQRFKLDLIKEFNREKKPLTIYKILRPGSGQADAIFTDLCKGGHVKNTKEIFPDAFKLTHLAGAYWRGDEKNPQLQRIYGAAFDAKEELEKYLRQQEEAKKRDHKELGQKLDLFTFSDLVGSGLPLFTPKGTIIRDLLDSFVWELRRKEGYQKVDIPHLAKKNLYEKSGHWDKFKDELFRITSRESHVFALKPMNCPHHIQIFARRKWSYRELPQRYASTTKVYRDEQTGELAGLTRVRSITQDDAHVFCRKSQVKEEMLKIWNIVETFYGTMGFELTPRISLHDPKSQKKYLGTPKIWNEAEGILKELAMKKKSKAIEAVGEAAFYGPKLDFLAKDSLGREWQVATIQLDMNLPGKFDLNFINEKGEEERIFIIHTAIMGAIERFMAILIEHTAGAFPLWLAPVQATIIPVSEKFAGYGKKLHEELSGKGVRAEIADSNETLGKRIREAELQKIPYILVVGEKEENSKTVNVRHYRRGQEGEIKIEKFVGEILKEIEEKTF